MAMDIAEIRHLHDEGDTSNTWIDPWLVRGMNIRHCQILNFKMFECEEEYEEDMRQDADLVSYLQFLYANRCFQRLSGIRLMEGVVYLIRVMWSVAATFCFYDWEEYIRKPELDKCIDIVKDTYAKAEIYPQYLLREFVIRMFDFEDKDWHYNISGAIRKENQAFLEAMPKRNIPAPKNLYLSEDDIPLTPYSIAMDSKTPQEVLAELAFHEDRFVRRIVAVNQSTPPEILIELAKDKDIWVKLALLHNSYTPPEITLQLKPLAEHYFYA